MKSFAAWLAGAAAGLGALAAACGGDTIPSGFQNLGGAEAATTGAGGTAETVASSSSHASSSSQSSSSTTSVASSSSGPACDDTGPGEPNEDEQHVVNLGDITDCDDTGDSVSGVIQGPSDVDWYKYHGSDTFGCEVDPARTFTAAQPLRICKFVNCDNAEAPSFSCPSGADAAKSPDGRPGCCSMGDFGIDLTCGPSSLNDDNATMFIRIDNPEGHVCVNYTVDYHF